MTTRTHLFLLLLNAVAIGVGIVTGLWIWDSATT